jgi:hypothetical protein
MLQVWKMRPKRTEMYLIFIIDKHESKNNKEKEIKAYASTSNPWFYHASGFRS